LEAEAIKTLLDHVKDGSMSINDAMQKLKILPFEDLGFAKIDHHRSLRNGYPEVIYCEGKKINYIITIIKKMLECGDSNILATRASSEIFDAVKSQVPSAQYYELARIIVVKRQETKVSDNRILVITGGTSDIPVAEEAAITAEVMGNHIDRLYDVGVAGIHRLLSYTQLIMDANVVITVAGMEGALASVIGGLVDKPVIAVPTSVGYGANFGGLSALLCMLNSCASGISVVNIDNGFGAGYLASMINHLSCNHNP